MYLYFGGDVLSSNNEINQPSVLPFILFILLTHYVNKPVDLLLVDIIIYLLLLVFILVVVYSAELFCNIYSDVSNVLSLWI